MTRATMNRGGERAMPGRRAGVAAMEFGLIAPVMGIFMMGLVDLADALITLHRLNTVVQQVGLMATELSVQPNQQMALTDAQVDQASSVIFAVMPRLASLPVYNATTKVSPPYAVVVSDVVFTPVTGQCTAGNTSPTTPNCYNASLAWSVPLQYGMQLNRACGSVNQSSAASSLSISAQTDLPTSVPTAAVTQGLSSVLVVDVVVQFTPIFGKFLGQLTMRQTAYFNPRSYVASYIQYNAGASTSGVVCSGYV